MASSLARECGGSCHKIHCGPAQPSLPVPASFDDLCRGPRLRPCSIGRPSVVTERAVESFDEIAQDRRACGEISARCSALASQLLVFQACRAHASVSARGRFAALRRFHPAGSAAKSTGKSGMRLHAHAFFQHADGISGLLFEMYSARHPLARRDQIRRTTTVRFDRASRLLRCCCFRDDCLSLGTGKHAGRGACGITAAASDRSELGVQRIDVRRPSLPS